MFCELDSDAASVLKIQHPNVRIWPDICTFHPSKVDVVAGGWPCQDLSIAGGQEGLKGLRSGLLRELLRVAVESASHTVVAENVANLLRMRNGVEFAALLEEFSNTGYNYVAWRLLNARQFGLPQYRSRLIIIASQDPAIADTLFRDIEPSRPLIDRGNADVAAGFYWTAGTHSINYTRGYVPTIKIGSTLGIASPPGVHYDGVVRTLSANEALALQGFSLTEADFPTRTAAFKAAGNAVTRDIGRWVLDGLALADELTTPKIFPTRASLFNDESIIGSYPTAGIYKRGSISPIAVGRGPMARNLSDFLDTDSSERLSQRAAAGLVKRLAKSGQPCPAPLKAALMAAAHLGSI